MRINSPSVHNQNDYDLSGTVQNSLTCSCKLHDCPNNGTKCIDNPDEPGDIQLPCLREMPSIELCSTCCLFGYLEGICAFCRDGV
jgi:hypothetical protein